MEVFQQIYSQLDTLGVIDLAQRGKQNAKTKNIFTRHVSYDLLYKKDHLVEIAISSYWKHDSGDMMADPDIQIKLDLNQNLAIPTAFQQDGVPVIGTIYLEVYPTGEPVNKKAQSQVNHFLTVWLQQLIDQKYQFNA